jgi:hypothetical protein
MAPVNKMVVVGGSRVGLSVEVSVIVGRGVSEGGGGVLVVVGCTIVELGDGVLGDIPAAILVGVVSMV